jgi:hypothetical protein
MQAILQNPFLKYLYGFLPTPRTLTLATICFALGMGFAYLTISFVDGQPSQLEQSYQDIWVQGVEARYREANSEAASNPDNIRSWLAQVDNPQEIVQRLGIGDQNFQQLAAQAQELAPAPPARLSPVINYGMPVIWTIVFAIAYTLLFFVWSFVLWPFVRDRVRTRTPEEIEKDKEAQEEIQKIKDIKALEKQMAEAATASEGSQKYGAHVIQKISMYQHGFGNYDDSFNIETEDKVYYGEAGGSIAEKIGDDGVTAIEVWMFDKDEFTNTPNTILASEHAFNDPGLKSRLEPKGTVALAKPGTVIKLETNALYVEARVADVEYKEGTAIPNSEFKKVTTQITAWSKGSSGGGGGTPAPVMPAMPVAPAPTLPAQPVAPAPTAPAGSPFDSYQPPAPSPTPPPTTSPTSSPFGGGSEPPPDDPFGGTGDFTPVNPNQ